MAGKEKVVAVVGVSEQDTAHLRLLLRKAQEQLKFHWRWGGEDGADLVLIDPKTFAGKLARNRFGATGARCVLLLDPGAPDEGVTQLRRPLKVSEFQAVLAQVEGGVVEGLDLVPISDDFYFGDNADFRTEHSLDELEPGTEEAIIIRNSGEADWDGLEDAFKHDPASDTPRVAVPISLGYDTAIEATGEPTARSEKRRAESGNSPRPGMRIDPDMAPPFKRPLEMESAAQPEPLHAFLTRKLLGGPSRVSLDGAPPLVLDPKNQCFHSSGSLKALEPYCRALILRSAWHALTSAEVTQLREAQAARAYEQLRWLDTLLRSGGRLASHLDPGGSYRLTRALDVAADYPHAARVAKAMMLPARLHEITSAAHAEMGEVFDVINAYEAIGCIEWTPRQPRHSAPAEENGRGGLLGKFKLPFGRK